MKIGPWEDYYERNRKIFYKCGECQTHSAMMKRRIVEDSDGKNYEYKIFCPDCEKSGSVHRNKALAEKTWAAMSDTFYENLTLQQKGGRKK